MLFAEMSQETGFSISYMNCYCLNKVKYVKLEDGVCLNKAPKYDLG
jgi:hypothetical protein